MSERKVLNKYYPPDFDPAKIPRAKCSKNRQFTVRLMAPCNMKCYTCGEYIAKGKKFNARKEDVENMTYLGIRIYRFYIKCPGCLSEISFRTDPESTDYIIEAGAHRNFQALKLAEDQAEREAQDAQDEIDSNPMLVLENRTQQSQYEMDLLENLEELRELNDRHAGIDLGKVAGKYQDEKKLTAEQIEEAERMEALKALGYEMIEGELVKRLCEDVEDDEKRKTKKLSVNFGNGSDHLTDGKAIFGSMQKTTLKSKFAGLVKIKKRESNEPKFAIPSIPPMKKVKTAGSSGSNCIYSKYITATNSVSKVISPPDNSITSTSTISNTQTPIVCASKPAMNGFTTDTNGCSSDSGGSLTTAVPNVLQPAASSLAMLGAYSDSSSDSDG